MGIYRTPYERFGQLSYEMWRAARLVIDTGIHRYGWSRQQAIDYLANHTALSQHEVETEVDRYISWPGQALSYKLGELTIRRLRARSRAGARAEVRRARVPRHDPGARLGAPTDPRRRGSPLHRAEPGGSDEVGSSLAVPPEQQRPLQQQPRGKAADVRRRREQIALPAGQPAHHHLQHDPGDHQPQDVDPAIDPQMMR